MGFDFETLLGVEDSLDGNAIQNAYDDAVERAGGYRPSRSDDYTFSDYLMGRLPPEYYDGDDESERLLMCIGECENCTVCERFERNCSWCKDCRCCKCAYEEGDGSQCESCRSNRSCINDSSDSTDSTAKTEPADDSACSEDAVCELLDPDREFEDWDGDETGESGCANGGGGDAEAENPAETPASGQGSGAGSSCEWDEGWFEQ